MEKKMKQRKRRKKGEEIDRDIRMIAIAEQS